MAESSSTSSGMRRQPRQARSQERVNRILDVAEERFIAEGYSATTTNAIAAEANIPIGSLYQFFPDKRAILQALAQRYMEVLHRRLLQRDPEAKAVSLRSYVDLMVDTVAQFYGDFPGYYAIFMQVQEQIPELLHIEEAADQQLVQELAVELAQRYELPEPETFKLIAWMLVKVIGTMLWNALGFEPAFRQQLIQETKRLVFSYLQSYFSSSVD